MKAYQSAADHIGMTHNTFCLFARQHAGHFVGRYAVSFLSEAFYCRQMAGVMDDFGNLVPVEA